MLERGKIMCYPPIDEFKKYPTLAPNGKILEDDINHKACSIELYLPDSVISDDGEYLPIEWEARKQIKQDKVDIKGSILIELSGVLHTSPNYLLGMEEYEEDLLEIITVYKNLKGSKTKQIALEQMKLLATMSSGL